MTLHIFLLGQFALRLDSQSIELPSRPAQSLLAYLALHSGVNHRREKLAGLLWPDSTETNARSYLRQALWRIRKSLEAATLHADDYLSINEIYVTFLDGADYWLDVDDFLESPQGRPVKELINMAELYQGELLPGFYDEWVLPERDRLQTVHHQILHVLLATLLRQQQWLEALHWSEEWIRLSQAPEPAYRAMMQAYAGMGDQGMVCTIYQRCVDALERELSLEPSLETQKLYQQITQGEWNTPEHTLPTPAGETSPQPIYLDETGIRLADTPLFVARKYELAELDHYLQLATTAQGRVMFVTGETGCGKTALLQEFSRRTQMVNPDLVVVTGNCNAHTGVGDPYLPFREMLELLTGDVETQWVAGMINRDQAQRLWDLLPLTIQAILETGPRLLNTFIPGRSLIERLKAGTPDQSDLLARLDKLNEQMVVAHNFDPNPQQSDLFEQYTRVCQMLSRHVVLVLVIDDLQWADLGSISLLFHLGRHIAGHRILLIGAFRPEEILLGREGTRHPLDPVVNEFQRLFGNITLSLDQAERHEFVDAILDSEPNQLGAAFREMLYQQTRGHPLFTIELLRGMQERGDLVRDNTGQWVEGPALEWETMPARIEAVIAERISRLPGPIQVILRTASVEGETFTTEVLARVRSMDESQLLEQLSNELDRRHRLVQGQSIQRINGQLISRYRFRHILFQKYLYSSLNEVERVHIHEQIGNTLEEIYGGQGKTIEIAPQLARHFQEAHITEKAIRYLQQAGDKAVSVSAYKEGINHLTRAMDLLQTIPYSPERDKQELSLQISLGMAWSGDIPGQKWATANTRARELCQKTGQLSQLCQVLGQLAIYHYVRAEYQHARTIAEEALALAQKNQYSFLEIMGHWYLGFILFGLGEFICARTHFQEVIAFYKPHLHHRTFLQLRGSDSGVSALAYDACCLWCLGYPEQAIQRSQEALQIAHDLDHAFSLADVIAFAGCLLNEMAGNASALKNNAEELIELSHMIGFAAWLGTATCYFGAALAMEGHYLEAIDMISQGKSLRLSRGSRCYMSGTYARLAETRTKLGDIDEGLAAFEDTFTYVEETNERYQEAEVTRLKGEYLLQQGDSDLAEAYFKRALEISQVQQAKSWELRSAISLAQLWQSQDNIPAARQVLASVYHWFSEGLETPDLLHAKSLLEQLSGGKS